MARLKIAGFETGDTSELVTRGANTSADGTVHTSAGAYSLKNAAGGTGNEFARGRSETHLKLFDDMGTVLAAADLTTLTLSILDEAGVVVNLVDEQDILDNDRGQFDTATGQLVITLGDDDTLLPDGVAHGVRSLLIQWTFGAAKSGGHQVYFKIVALG